MKHTPTPWFASDTADPTYIDITTDPDGCDASIAHVFWKDGEFPEFGGTGHANAHLIVECVNICNGKPEAVQELIEAAKIISSHVRTIEGDARIPQSALARLDEALTNLKKEMKQ